MEYITTLECVQDFVKYLCKTEQKTFGDYEDYHMEDMDFISMKWLIDGLYNKFLLSGTYSINTSSPVVISYNHICSMLDRVVKNELETENQELTSKISELEKELQNLKNKDNTKESKNPPGWFN